MHNFARKGASASGEGTSNYRRSQTATKTLASPFPGGKPSPNRQLTCSQSQPGPSSVADVDVPEEGSPENTYDKREEPSPKRAPAFDPNGPLEAVALHSDWQFWNVFSDVRTIGKGHFAKVKHVRHNESREHFAAKILDKSLAENDLEDLVRFC